MLLAIIILAIAGGLNAWTGYALKYQRRYHLIAGFDAAKVRDPDALAVWLGNGGFALAAVCAGGILALLAIPDAMPAITMGVGLAVFVIVLVIAGRALGRTW